MSAVVDRLTPRGMQLRTHGITQLTDAPTLPIAGFSARAPGSPWVLRADGTIAKLWIR